MKSYKIKHDGRKMTISHRDTGATIAEYLLTPGHERAEIAQMRRVIDRHLAADGNGTLGNYQW